MRVRLAAGLRARRVEIEQAIHARVSAVSDPGGDVEDVEYATGLKSAVSAALGYGIDCIEGGASDLGTVPEELSMQARHAARNGISVDTVLRRYFVGYTLLGDFVIEVAEDDALSHGSGLQQVLRDKAVLLDHLVVIVSEEHSRELRGRARTTAQRRAENVRRLLRGELIDLAELHYELDAWHVGAIAAGPGAAELLRELANAGDRRLLTVPARQGVIWGWLGGRRRVTTEHMAELAKAALQAETSLALGEPAHALDGWRLTHRQASSALPIAQRRAGRLVRYADVALLASVLRDEVLARSLEEIYLAPLTRGQTDGAALRQTLRAYFEAGRNVASAAAAMGLSRQTVHSRLHVVEERVGRTLDSCAAELETALELSDLATRPLLC